MSFSMKLRKVIYNLFFWVVLIYSMWLILFKLATDFTTIKIIWAGPIAGMAALLFSALKVHDVLFAMNDNNHLKEIQNNLKKGFFNIQKKEFFLTLISLAVIFPLIYKFLNLPLAICFLAGSITIFISSFLSSLVSINVNSNILKAAETSPNAFYKASVNGGYSTFLIPVGFCMILFPVLYFIYKDPAIIMGFAFGACLEAFLIIAFDEIYSKASNIIYLEKEETKEAVMLSNGINAKNSAVDYAVSFIAVLTGAMLSGVLVLNLFGAFIPLTLAATGIFCTILASIFAKLKGAFSSKISLFTAFVVSVILYLGISFYIVEKVFMPKYGLFYPVLIGALAAVIIAGAGYFNLRVKKDELKNHLREEINSRNLIAAAIPLLIGGFAAIASFLYASGMESYSAGFWGLGLAAVSMLSITSIFGAMKGAANISKNALISAENENQKNIVSEFFPAFAIYGAKSETIFSIVSLYASILLFVAFATTINLEGVDCLNPFVAFALIFGAGIAILPIGLINGSYIKAVKKVFKNNATNTLQTIKTVTNKGFVGIFLPVILTLLLPLFVYFAILKLFEKTLALHSLTGALLGAIVVCGVISLLFGSKNALFEIASDSTSKENSAFVSNIESKLIAASVLLVSALLMPVI